jgi:hypothetical protein
MSYWRRTKEGFPSRRAKWAHVGDAVTYPVYRLFGPRPAPGQAGGTPRRGPRKRSLRERELDGLL